MLSVYSNCPCVWCYYTVVKVAEGLEISKQMNRNQTGKRTDQERFAELLSRGQISRALLTWIDVFKKEWPLTYSKMDLQLAVRFFTGAGNNMDSERVYLIGSEDEPKKCRR